MPICSAKDDSKLRNLWTLHLFLHTFNMPTAAQWEFTHSLTHTHTVRAQEFANNTQIGVHSKRLLQEFHSFSWFPYWLALGIWGWSAETKTTCCCSSSFQGPRLISGPSDTRSHKITEGLKQRLFGQNGGNCDLKPSGPLKAEAQGSSTPTSDPTQGSALHRGSSPKPTLQ